MAPSRPAGIPADLSSGPYGQALELANKATFTPEELDAYRKVIDEIQQVRELVDAKLAQGLVEGHKAGRAEGLAEGRAEGLAEGHKAGQRAGKTAALLAILAARGLHATAGERDRIERCQDEATLDQWIARATAASSVEAVLGSSTGSS
ncbi:MAG: hypothetical protein R3F14_10740 [Polyangiaceae bacterium]